MKKKMLVSFLLVMTYCLSFNVVKSQDNSALNMDMEKILNTEMEESVAKTLLLSQSCTISEKLFGFQVFLKDCYGITLPLYISPKVATKISPPNPDVLSGKIHLENLLVSNALTYFCQANGLKMSIKKDVILIETADKTPPSEKEVNHKKPNYKFIPTNDVGKNAVKIWVISIESPKKYKVRVDNRVFPTVRSCLDLLRKEKNNNFILVLADKRGWLEPEKELIDAILDMAKERKGALWLKPPCGKIPKYEYNRVIDLRGRKKDADTSNR